MNLSITGKKIMNSSDNFGIFFYFISAMAQSSKKKHHLQRKKVKQ